MIVVAESDYQWTLVTQGDHARLAAQLVELWRRPPLAELPDADELLFAVREHDNGWREVDAAPRLHPEGDRPHDFLSLPAEERGELWQRGSARYERQHPLAALLVTEHALHLLGGAEGHVSSLDRLHRRRDELLERTGCPGETLEELYRWLALADWLSLVACNRWNRPFDRLEVRGRWHDACLYLDPFPFAGPTTFELPIRHVPRRPYTGDRDLGVEVMSSPWRRLPVRVAPMSSFSRDENVL